ncbi:glycosyltransferase [Candidatus Woesebacteria bacterium]|nr:glycosyltransferase [Candidatus Woesebacteria bacterium]
MKIAMISSPFVPVPPKKYGGTERVIYYLIKGLLEKGHEVTLFATGDSEVECELVPICEKHLFFGKNESGTRTDC